MFTARRAVPSTLETPALRSSPGPRWARWGGLLPAASVTDDGGQIHPLRGFRPSVLAIVPAGCQCAPRHDRSATRRTPRAYAHFVAISPALPQARKLARKARLSADHVVADTRDAMGRA